MVFTCIGTEKKFVNLRPIKNFFLNFYESSNRIYEDHHAAFHAVTQTRKWTRKLPKIFIQPNTIDLIGCYVSLIYHIFVL